MSSRLTVLLLTYAEDVESPRHEYAMRTLGALLKHLHADDVSVGYHIADDGSGPGHVDGLIQLLADHGLPACVTNAERAGYGASYNLASQVVHPTSDYILPVEDDWELQRFLPVDALVRAIEASSGHIRSVRLGYLGWTQPLRGELTYSAGQGFLLLDPDSPENHVAAGHPRLETVEYERAIGPWAEGVNPGATEFSWCRRPEARRGVAWPLDLGIHASQSHASLFAHIGAVQAREDQR